jgi:hypothetical protein
MQLKLSGVRFKNLQIEFTISPGVSDNTEDEFKMKILSVFAPPDESGQVCERS